MFTAACMSLAATLVRWRTGAVSRPSTAGGTGTPESVCNLAKASKSPRPVSPVTASTATTGNL